jgi:hypothetical protein
MLAAVALAVVMPVLALSAEPATEVAQAEATVERCEAATAPPPLAVPRNRATSCELQTDAVPEDAWDVFSATPVALTQPAPPPHPSVSEMNSLIDEFQDQGATGDWCNEAGEIIDRGTPYYQKCRATSPYPGCAEFIEVFQQLFDLWWNNC